MLPVITKERSTILVTDAQGAVVAVLEAMWLGTKENSLLSLSSLMWFRTISVQPKQEKWSSISIQTPFWHFSTLIRVWSPRIAGSLPVKSMVFGEKLLRSLGMPVLPGRDVSSRGRSLMAHLGHSSHRAVKAQSSTAPTVMCRLYPKCISVDASYRIATLQQRRVSE